MVLDGCTYDTVLIRIEYFDHSNISPFILTCLTLRSMAFYLRQHTSTNDTRSLLKLNHITSNHAQHTSVKQCLERIEVWYPFFVR
jgi:hypothetical protein